MTFQDNPKFHPDKHHKRSPNRVGWQSRRTGMFMTVPHSKDLTRAPTNIRRGVQVETTDRRARRECPSLHWWHMWQKTE
jgi:hypothetical protein